MESVSLDSNIFCQTCGMLLDFQLANKEEVECRHCGKTVAIDFLTAHAEVEVHINKGEKTWLNELLNVTQKEELKKKNLIIEEDCPKCDSKKFKYFTLQTRSVDEGTTVFYECVKCGYSYSTNN